MTTEEGNKLIAEFMDYRFEYSSNSIKIYKPGASEWYYGCRLDEPYEISKHLTTDFQYHISWDWLMPVVQNISEYYNQADEILYHKLREVDLEIFRLSFCGPDIDYAIQCVIKFILWYNTQSK